MVTETQMAMQASEALRAENRELIGSYVVNIGSNDGKSMDDPCYEFFSKLESPGVCLDGGLFPSIHQHLPWERVKKIMGKFVAPGNIGPFLRSEGTPNKGHFLKIDIDGFDAQILSKMLSLGFEFDIIQIEVNPEFPPPVRFAVQFHPMFKPGGQSGFYGASCAYVADCAAPYGYVPLALNMESPSHDLLLVHERHANLFEIEPLADLFNAAPSGHSHFYFNLGIDCSNWADRKDYDYLLPEMWSVVTQASRAKLGDVFPFVLEIPRGRL